MEHVNNASTPLIETRDLKKYFDVGKNAQLHAVDGINMKLFPGKTIGVVGESGCGKSTLGRTILQLLKPTSGEVLFKGENICNASKSRMKELRSQMQIIFQDPYSSLNPRMTVEELIAEYMIVAKKVRSTKAASEEVYHLMDVVGLDHRFGRVYPHELDGGRRQRIGVARALSLGPEFVVCDEPVSALDVSIQAQILNLLMDIQEQQKLAYMFITHDLSVVKHISDQIMVMYLGQCIEWCETDELFDHPIHPYTQALLEALPVADLSMRTKKIHVIKGEITSPVNPKPGCRFAARCPYATERCHREQPPFEEVSPGHYVACFEKKG
ncbi:MAG: ATP-binding cassette domain-containing protein [Ruminococcaceae bacterium]|nr:ATP-binding cassette domain-containing protein [Oscillospiraceae bacterium]